VTAEVTLLLQPVGRVAASAMKPMRRTAAEKSLRGEHEVTFIGALVLLRTPGPVLCAGVLAEMILMNI
jgi:hypothetical protein